jgi:hypothetical protein
MAQDIDWNKDKDIWLQRRRGLSFSMVVEAIENGLLLDDIEHPSPERAHQRVLVFKVQGYAVAVPYVTDGKTQFLKTMHFDRDLNAKYGGKDG